MALTLDILETARLDLQHELNSSKTRAERNKLGQFATPPALAEDILAYARKLCPPRSGIRFVDPAFGTGAFYSALLKVFSSSQIVSAVGYEIDVHCGQKALQLWGGSRLKLRISDFTQTEVPTSDEERANLLICNPPYVRHHHLSESEKTRLRYLTQQIAGVQLGGLTGLYCYFLCISYGWMAEGGLAGWLVPSEFMDVNYGRPLKEFLLSRVTLLRIHRFDPKDTQFDDALVSSAVVWFRKAPPSRRRTVDFTYGGTLAEPGVSKSVSLDALRSIEKWSQVPLRNFKNSQSQKKPSLSDLFEIKRGVATGSNEFFMLTSARIEEYKISEKFVWPILPSPRYLSADEVKANESGDPIVEPKLFLLTCKLSLEQIQAKCRGLWRYLQMGLETGIDKGYLCRSRSPWYSQETRGPAPILCTYMGRLNDRNRRPFRFIRNHSKATVANVYLAMYPRPHLAKILDEHPRLWEALWKSLNGIPQDMLLAAGRVYGGGLHKLEPVELGSVPANSLMEVLPNAFGTQLGIRASQLRFEW